MASAATTSKLLKIGQNPTLQSLICSNLLRTTTIPISRVLKSTMDFQVPIQFDREVPNVKTNAPTAAEILKTMNPGLGFSSGMTGLPGIDQSERILKPKKRPSKVDDDDEIEDNFGEDDFPQDSVDYSDCSDVDAGDFNHSDSSAGSDSDD